MHPITRSGAGTARRYPSCHLKSKFVDGSPVNIPYVPLMWFTLIRDFSIAILGKADDVLLTS